MLAFIVVFAVIAFFLGYLWGMEHERKRCISILDEHWRHHHDQSMVAALTDCMGKVSTANPRYQTRVPWRS